MPPSRRSQPYRKRSPFRRQGPALKAMLRGRDAFGRNPMDAKRRLKKNGPLGNRRKRRRSVRNRY